MAYNLQNLLKVLRTPEVRELAWVLGSNQLFESKELSDFSHSATEISNGHLQLELHAEWLLDLDENPESLLTHLASCTSQLLGKRFEAFVHFWLIESEHFELLLCNKQLIQNKLTIGEVDFIFRDVKSNEVIHLEVACKFYLAKENKQNWANFIGPNGSDNLEEKMLKLKKQLQLFSGPHRTFAEEQSGFKSPIPHAFVKGYIFHHLQNIAKAKPPKNAFPRYNAAWYIKHSETALLAEQDWCILEKTNWLATVNGNTGKLQTNSTSELQLFLDDHFKRRQYGICIAQLIDLGDGLQESSRGLVVSRKWW